MEENKHPHIGHETTDVNIWAIGRFGIGLAVLCILTLVLLFGLFRYFQFRENTAAVKVIDPVRTFPQPQLQTTPKLDLKEVREAEDQMLSTYGWVDQPKGVVRIPIDRAIELLAQRGLPARADSPKPETVSVPTESGLGGIR